MFEIVLYRDGEGWLQKKDNTLAGLTVVYDIVRNDRFFFHMPSIYLSQSLYITSLPTSKSLVSSYMQQKLVFFFQPMLES